MSRLLPILAVLLALPLPSRAEDAPDGEESRFAWFKERMNNALLVGKFTIKGQETGEGRSEEYHILEVSKLPRGDYWLFRARIKYGGKNLTLPIPLQVKWAEGTPVITLEETTIPGLGTFSTRLMIYDDQYAGIWKHGEIGGQMFGTIKAGKAQEE